MLIFKVLVIISSLQLSTACLSSPPTTTTTPAPSTPPPGVRPLVVVPAPAVAPSNLTTFPVWSGSCNLDEDGNKFSTIGVSTYQFIFEEDGSCRAKIPDRWDEWTSHYFGSEAANISLYDDNDNDGLVNIIEYYFDQLGTYSSARSDSYMRQAPISDLGLDPTDGDTDGDFLTDGFEWYFGMDAKNKDNILLDSDGDSLDNIREMIEGTDPYIADSDGDGVLDGEEVAIGIDPLDESERAQEAEIRQNFAEIRLTVGDPSKSASERWILHVGSRKYQNDDNRVGSTTYIYGPGEYDIWLEHGDTNVTALMEHGCPGRPQGADFDWQAWVLQVGGLALVTVEDPEGLLVYYNGICEENIAEGRMAKLTVECRSSSNSPQCTCQALHSNCSSCMEDSNCRWKNNRCMNAPSSYTDDAREEEKLMCFAGDCTFYDEIESLLPCGVRGYALGHAKYYCNRFDSKIDTFDDEGKIWAHKSRKCMQEAMIETVEKDGMTCDSLRQDGLDSHLNCYAKTKFCRRIANRPSNVGALRDIHDLYDADSVRAQAQIDELIDSCYSSN